MNSRKPQAPASSDPMPLTEIPGEATRRRILDVAEQLFVERGFGVVSLREIVLKAGVNTASAHYHFGSKEELIRQVVERRAPPVIDHFNELLDEAAAFKGEPDYLERIVSAMITPTIRGRSRRDRGARIFNTLRARLFTEDLDLAESILNQVYQSPSTRILAALQIALPDMPSNELAWKLQVIFGAQAANTTWIARIHPVFSTTYRPDDPDEAIHYLVPIFVAVLRAPVPAEALRRKEPATGAKA